MSFIQNISVLLLPVTLVMILDQSLKTFCNGLELPQSYGLLRLIQHENFGVMLGGLQNIAIEIRMLSLSLLAGTIIMAYLLVSTLLSRGPTPMKIGLGIFVGGALSNLVDRVRFGFVYDHFQLRFGEIHTGIFNIADALQWVGVLLFFSSLIAKGPSLWPKDDSRKRWIIKPFFQFRFSSFCLAIAAASLLSLAFFSVAMMTTQSAEPGLKQLFYVGSLGLFGMVLMSTWIAGMAYSNRIAGPIFAFERFLDNLLLGKVDNFSIREKLEFGDFERLAQRFRENTLSELGLEAAELPAGVMAPGFHCKTYDRQSINLEDYRGKKLWLCFYRNVTCLICIQHIVELSDRFPALREQGLNVIAIFDSKPEDFHHDEPGRTTAFLSSVPFPLISNPDKSLYRKFRTRTSKLGLFHPKVFKNIFRSFRSGFKYGHSDGELNQLPAHILIDEDGTISQSYHGAHFADHISWADVESFLKQT